MNHEGVKPVIAITMGDPCGIGPEIIARAVVRAEVAETCRPFVLGDRAAMERALAVTGSALAMAGVNSLEPSP